MKYQFSSFNQIQSSYHIEYKKIIIAFNVEKSNYKYFSTSFSTPGLHSFDLSDNTA